MINNPTVETVKVIHAERLHRGYPLSVYQCPNGHENFYSRANMGAVDWCCPDCRAEGKWLYCAGEGHTWLRAARPVAPRAVDTRISVKRYHDGRLFLMVGLDLPLDFNALSDADKARARKAFDEVMKRERGTYYSMEVCQ